MPRYRPPSIRSEASGFQEAPAPKRPTNVSLDPDLVAEAKELGINISRACEQGLLVQIRQARRENWLRDNKAAMESWNEWIEKNGIPLAEYRKF